MARTLLRTLLAGVALAAGLAAAGGEALAQAPPPAASPAPSPAKAQRPLLAEKHKVAGKKCAACHVESPPADDVGTAKCLECHGTREKLAAKTEKADPNPHQSHQGDLDCNACHHVHKASENNCEKCHAWVIRTP